MDKLSNNLAFDMAKLNKKGVSDCESAGDLRQSLDKILSNDMTLEQIRKRILYLTA
jgi:hypothetical protein